MAEKKAAPKKEPFGGKKAEPFGKGKAEQEKAKPANKDKK